MSTTSECCSTENFSTAGKIFTGLLVAAGVSVLVWMLLSRHHEVEELDPLTEADRRIDALEESLRHLHESFGQAVGK